MKAEHRPNVLIIHTDQHRQDCIGAYGNMQVRTPHLDTLAADGVLHTRHFCSYPVCTPSRYSLISGQYVHQHLGWNNYCTLPAGIPTFPRLLKQAGYKTAAVGKMHYTPAYLDVGFSQMTLAEQDGPGRFEDDYHEYLREQGLLDQIDLTDQRSEYRRHAGNDYWQTFGAGPSDLPLEHHSTSFITRHAVNALKDWSEGGNLLMVGYIKPHYPFDPPKTYSDMYDPDKLDLLPGYTDLVHDPSAETKGYFEHKRLSPEALRRVMAMYYATITQIDDSVGLLIKQLKLQNMYSNTLIIFTSDHGEYLGYHHLLLKGFRMFEPLMKIPLIIKPVNGSIGVCDQLSSNTDIAAYILKTCGVEAASGMSKHGLMLGENGRPFIVAESMQGSGQVEYMLRTERYKLILEGNTDKAVLYDLVEDPYEFVDLAQCDACQKLIDSLRQLLYQEVLFQAPSRVHLDRSAPVIDDVDPVELEQRRNSVREWHTECTGIRPL